MGKLYLILFIAVWMISGCSTCTPSKTPTCCPDILSEDCYNQICCTDRCELQHQQPEPARIQVIKTCNRLKIVVFSDRCFEPELRMPYQPRINSVCAAKLSQLAIVLKAYKNRCIGVVGYTDRVADQQTAESNTQKQADTIASFLWSHGIPVRRLTAYGVGGDYLVASYRNVVANSANRRVEILVQ
jgi:flagellar motor protein MotB